MYGAGEAVLAGLALALLLKGTLLKQLGGVVAPEIGRLKLFNAPSDRGVASGKGGIAEEMGRQRTCPSPCQACHSCTWRAS